MNKRTSKKLPSTTSSENKNQDSLHLRLLVVTNPNTPARVLHEIARDEERVTILERIAEHPRCPADLMLRLVAHESPQVRAALIENPNLPEELLDILARDQSVDVRYTLAESYHIGLHRLRCLCDDDNPYVSYRARRTISRLTDCEPAKWMHSTAGAAQASMHNPFRQFV